MIPEKSTPIKNDILINIFAKGLLSGNEIRIVAYIIRWSWGFDDKENSRRQDWTKPLTKKKIADDIKMNTATVIDYLNKMIKENKVLVKDKCYQFNEHFEDWRRQKTLNSSMKNIEKLNENIEKLNEKHCKTQSSTGEIPLNDKGLRDRKDNKDNVKINKENILNSKLLTLNQIKKEKDTDMQPKNGTAYKATCYLIDKISTNNRRARVPNKDPTNSLMEKWVDEMEKLNRLGPVGSRGSEHKGYSWKEIKKIINWCQDDSFWKLNIKSTAKLRGKITTLEDNMEASKPKKSMEESLKEMEEEDG